MAEEPKKPNLETLGHLLALAAGVVYFVGFAIISINGTRFGIADFGFFRVKAIAVGTLFILLLILPVMLTLRIFSVFGLSFRSPVSQVAKTEAVSWRTVMTTIGLFLPCAFFAWPLSLLFREGYQWKPHGYLFVPLTYAGSFGLLIWSKTRYSHDPIVGPIFWCIGDGNVLCFAHLQLAGNVLANQFLLFGLLRDRHAYQGPTLSRKNK
jgi:hypothetical protein